VRAKGRRGKGSSRARSKRRSPKPDAQRPKPYEYLPHPADVGFLARGKTLETVFEAAALALCDCGWELAGVRARKKLDITAHAATLEDLMFIWLSEILYAMDAEGWLFCDFRIGKLEATAIEAEGWGERREPGERRRVAVKAVTYHQVSVQKINEGWEAVVYFDI